MFRAYTRRSGRVFFAAMLCVYEAIFDMIGPLDCAALKGVELYSLSRIIK